MWAKKIKRNWFTVLRKSNFPGLSRTNAYFPGFPGLDFNILTFQVFQDLYEPCKSQILLVFTALSLTFAVDLVALRRPHFHAHVTSLYDTVKGSYRNHLKYLGSLIPKSYCWSLRILGVFNSFYLAKQIPGGYSGFQVAATIEGFFWVWNFQFQDAFGHENFGKNLLG